MPKAPIAGRWSAIAAERGFAPPALTIDYAGHRPKGGRSDSENRNKELKGELLGDRLSDQCYLANYFRFFPHTLACNVATRRVRGLLSGSWPYLNFYQAVSQAVLGFLPPALSSG